MVVTAKRPGSNYDNSYQRYGWSGTFAEYQSQYGYKGWSYDNIVNYHNQVYGRAYEQDVQRRDSMETARLAREKLYMWLAYANLMPWGGGGGIAQKTVRGLRLSYFKRVYSLSAGKVSFDLCNPKSFEGANPNIIENWLKQNGWQDAGLTKSGGGVKFSNGNYGEQIRVMPGYLQGNRPDLMKAGPYLEMSIKG